MSKVIHIIVTVLILASLILQILALLGNFNGLRSVYIARLELTNPPSSGGFFDDLLDKATNTISDRLPDYFTLALFIACEGKSTNETVCTPPAFGYHYNTTGILQTVQNQIPDWVHKALTGIQGGVFIPSVIFCFILLCYSLYHQFSGHRAKHSHGWCRKIMIFLVPAIAFLFCLATFVIQIVIYNMLKSGANKVKSNLFGGLIDDVVIIDTKSGPSIWMSLAAFICLFFVTILLCVSVCCIGGGRSRRTRQDNSYEMDRV
ncbi:uncharacterized protein ATC70_012313 [Mucor velutinosus]|uniref:Uncharacterized protein n=1 Tax=Mucor velutinosus TaxID=708070 RepID=A0AAN7HXS5_9FUNG|nr:hypothetical protein ATC70_012313 [Mucor velutinosus]